MISRRQAITALVKAHPGRFSKAELARLFGISKERVRQIVQLEDLEPYLRRRSSSRQHPTCARCGKPISHGAQLCAKCYAEVRPRGHRTLRCAWCGREFSISVSRYETKLRAGQKRFFCSKDCRLAWWSHTLREIHRNAF